MEGPTPLSTRLPEALRGRRGLLTELLTFERLLTGPVTHLIYWCGLALIALFAFGVVGGGVGLIVRSGPLEGLLLAFPTIVIGLLVAAVLALIWRSVCEFFVAVFQIAEDLRAIRLRDEAAARTAPAPAVSPGPRSATS